jgi:hypothetical protein
LCYGQEEHEDEEERTNSRQPRRLLDSFDNETLLQEWAHRIRWRQIQGSIEVLGKNSTAAMAPPTQSSGAGRVPVDNGKADNEAACRGDVELDGDDTNLVGDDVELVGDDVELVGNDMVVSSELVGDDVELVDVTWSMVGNDVAMTCGGDAELDSDTVGDDAELPETASASPAPQRCPSRIQGVVWNASSQSWTVRIMSQGVLKTLGSFDNEKVATRAYDKAAIECDLLDQLNFDDYAELHETAVASSAPQKRLSRFRGVSWHAMSKKWRARSKVQGVEKHLGSFDDK